MVEQAGGASSCDGKCVSALDIPILTYDQRTEICFGSKGEVKRFEEYLYGEAGRMLVPCVNSGSLCKPELGADPECSCKCHLEQTRDFCIKPI
jgi:hypothetical protein